MITLNLSQTAEYALRAMIGLALGPAGEPMRAQELSERTGVPLPYLWKIMRRLVDAGLVHSAKGHGGGFRLARAPERISYMDILEVNGYRKGVDTCVFGWGRCRSDRPCPMHRSWSELNDGFAAWARSATLATAAGSPPVAGGRRGTS